METKPARKKPSALMIILIVFGGLIALCVFCGIVSTVADKMGLLPTSTPTLPPTSTASPLPTETPSITPSPTITFTPTLTFTPIPPAELTKQASVATATELARYLEIDWRELKTYPDNHIGELVKVRITIFNIITTTQLQGYFYGTYDAIIIQMREPFSGIYEDDVIVVYGVVLGKQCGTNAFGAEVCQPALVDAFYTK